MFFPTSLLNRQEHSTTQQAGKHRHRVPVLLFFLLPDVLQIMNYFSSSCLKFPLSEDSELLFLSPESMIQKAEYGIR
jgi:hypothetical protein